MLPALPDPGDSDPANWFSNRQRAVRFDQRALVRFVARLRALAGGREFAVRIASDAALRQANRKFRKKNYTTDVLSFPDGGERLGDILISAARARRQARLLGHSVDQELQVLLLHGLLHLLGYDHHGDGGRMRRREQSWRLRLGLPAGLIKRAKS